VTCFPELGTVYSFDWSAAGDRLVLGKPPGEPIQVLDLVTGSVASLASADDPGVAELLGHKDRDTGSIQYVDPTWSPSGSFVAAMAMDGGSTPVVFSSDGTLVASGHSNPEFRPFSWSPTADVLAYATGVLGKPTLSTPAVYLLNPVTGEDTLLISTANDPKPDILDLVWSPDGRWIAMGNLDLIRIASTTESAAPPVIVNPFSQAPGALIDWED
jgi:Tol biopolymer transport system component